MTDLMQPPTSTSIPRRDTHTLAASMRHLLSHPGPFASLYLTVGTEDDRDASVRAVAAHDRLPWRVRALATQMIERSVDHDDETLVLLTTASEALSTHATIARTYPEPIAGPLVELAPLPRLGPVLEAEQRLRHHLLAVTTDAGLDLLTFPTHGDPTMHRADVDDIDHTAMLITEAAKQSETPLVIIAAAPQLADQLVRRVATAVPITTKVRVLDVAAGPDELADAAVRTVADDVAADAVAAIRGWRFQRSHGATVDGAVDAIDALRQRRARMLLISDEPTDRRRAWFGTDPSHVAVDLEDASISLPVAELESGRLADVLIRSAILQGVPLTLLPSLPSSTLDGGVGVVIEDPSA